MEEGEMLYDSILIDRSGATLCGDTLEARPDIILTGF